MRPSVLILLLAINQLVACDMQRHHTYRFSDHFAGMQWLDELPPGTLTDEIDLDLYSVKVSRQGEEHHIYVGPVDPYRGGSAITITLDGNLRLQGYVEEILAPAPGTGD
jgi:hypothetical protein